MENPSVHPSQSREIRDSRKAPDKAPSPDQAADFAALLGQWVQPLDPELLPKTTSDLETRAPAPERPAQRELQARPEPESKTEARDDGDKKAAAVEEVRVHDSEAPPSSKPLASLTETSPQTKPAAPEANTASVEADTNRVTDSASPQIAEAPLLGEATDSGAAGPSTPTAPRGSEIEKVARAVAQLAADKPAVEREPELQEQVEAKSRGPAIASELSSEPPQATPSREPSGELELYDVLAAEDELAEREMHRQDQMERQRGLDDARIRAQVAHPVAEARPAGQEAFGQGGQGFSNGQGQTGREGKTSPEVKALDALASTQAAQAPRETAATPSRVRRTLQAAVERVREMQKERSFDQGKVALTIRLDDATQVKLTISPRGDGTHELALLVADPKLRHELQRSLPEIRDVTTELPIDVAEVLIGEMVDPGGYLEGLSEDQP